MKGQRSSVDHKPLLRVLGDLDHTGGPVLVREGKEELGPGGVLALVGVRPNVRRVMEVVGIPGIPGLRLFTTQDEAIAGL